MQKNFTHGAPGQHGLESEPECSGIGAECFDIVKVYQVLFAQHEEIYYAPNFTEFTEEYLSEILDSADDAQFIVCEEYGKIKFDAALFHYCFAEGKLTLDELIKNCKIF